MAQEIATLDETRSATVWSAPSLPTALQELVDEGGEYAVIPVVGPAEAEILRAAMVKAKPDLTPCPIDKIEEMMIATAVMHPDAKLGDHEQRIRLRGYIKALKDLPYDVLSQAFLECAQEVTFFPKAAEIRLRAAKILRERWKLHNRMATLEMKHRHEYLPPPPDEGTQPTAEQRDEFNLIMRKMGVKQRMWPNGDFRPLEAGEEDPAPPLAHETSEEPGAPL